MCVPSNPDSSDVSRRKPEFTVELARHVADAGSNNRLRRHSRGMSHTERYVMQVRVQ